MTDEFMHIGEVAERTEVSLRTLRHWEEAGLLQPSGRTDGGFRLYADSDVERIMLVRRMKPLGWSIEEMRLALADIDVLRDPSSDDHAGARERLSAVLDDTHERRATLQRQLDRADEFIGILTREIR